MRKGTKCSYLPALIVQICLIKNYASQENYESQENYASQEIVSALHNLEATTNDLKAALYESQIIPDVLEDVPKQVIQASFGDNVVNLGNKLKLLDIMVPPSHVSWEFEKDTLYTLILSGPDYPSKFQHNYREFPHWVVGNIPQDSFMAGETVFDYQYPPNSYDIGTHRLVFTLYKQNGTIPVLFDENILKKRENFTLVRKYFKTEIFGRKYRMEAPIGVNFFEVDL